jgi:hypothetical protein
VIQKRQHGPRVALATKDAPWNGLRTHAFALLALLWQILSGTLQALQISMPLRATLLDGADVVVVGDSNWHLVGRLVSRFLEVSTLVIARRLWEAGFVRRRWLISER